LLWDPAIFSRHPFITVGLLLPVIYFTVLIVRNPNVLLLENYWGEMINWNGNLNRSSRPKKSNKTVDEVLDKINRKGIKSLTDDERAILKRHMKD